MPAPAQPIFPALYLYPLNDSFIPKHISLAHGQRVKIGRQTNAKTAPGERNGYFDSKVLSRQHAEVWEDGGKIYIKDVKSSNGTFINGERLSPEGIESEPNELKNDDIVEFGIDIVGDDNKTIIHHKVAARVVCIFTEQDVQVAARIEQINAHASASNFQPSSSPSPSQPNPNNGQQNASGSAGFPFAPGQQRRPQMPQQGLAGMGGMGGGLRAPGKSGLTFDHILSRLQGELQKSRDTGSELHTLTGAMNDIHDTLGGNLPTNLPPYPSNLPPVRAPAPPPAPIASGSPSQPSEAPSAALTSSALAELQSKLSETQSSLSSHVNKIHALEGVLAEQESIKLEVRALRELVETSRQQHEPRGGFDEEEDGELMHDDDDDARSIATVIPHELDRVEEEDEEQLAAANASEESSEPSATSSEADAEDREAAHEAQAQQEEEERRRHSSELGRPRTPEPTLLGLRTNTTNDPFSSHPPVSLRSSPPSPLSHTSTAASTSTTTDPDTISHVLEQLGLLLTLTSSLEAQHAAAQSTISALESKVAQLEATVKATQEAAAAAAARAPSPAPPASASLPDERETLTTLITDFQKRMEGQWSLVRSDWESERTRLKEAREQWEEQARSMDTGLSQLGATAASIKAQQDQISQTQKEQLEALSHARREPLVNGDVKHNIGLVTPPSPRSLSADSNRPRRKSRRGRSRSRQRSRSASSGSGTEDTDATLASEEPHGDEEDVKKLSSPSGSPLKARVKQSNVYTAPEEEEDGDDTVLGVRSKSSGAETLATPESSVYIPSDSSKPQNGSAVSTTTKTSVRENELIQLRTAVGVLVLGVAAAAVIWRVKPET
ncbi:hypothetical protein H0H87_005370 [Tephrocybe sp. NHM501043]|nr:hypothetical protein H0H87_005370 [Tephrocybe sp. NHM501043]